MNPPLPARSRTARFELPLSAGRALPLFTAEGERLWVPGWDPEILSDCGSSGGVFRTSRGGVQTVWLVVEYDPARGRARYARIAQGSNMGLVEVICLPLPGERCEVQVTYTLTGLDPAGERFVDEFLEPSGYTQAIAGWQQAIVAHLASRAAA